MLAVSVCVSVWLPSRLCAGCILVVCKAALPACGFDFFPKLAQRWILDRKRTVYHGEFRSLLRPLAVRSWRVVSAALMRAAAEMLRCGPVRVPLLS